MLSIHCHNSHTLTIHTHSQFTHTHNSHTLTIHTHSQFTHTHNSHTLTIHTSHTLTHAALMSLVTVQLTISDVNDNFPRFQSDLYSAEIPEYLAVGASALTVFANDPDVGSNGVVTYKISANPRFTVHPDSGEITTTGPLDHEEQNRYTLTVTVSNHMQPHPHTHARGGVTCEPIKTFQHSFCFLKKEVTKNAKSVGRWLVRLSSLLT